MPGSWPVGKALFLAFALMLVLEGLLPFIAPHVWRELFRRIIGMSDGQIRFFGLSSMIAGLVLLVAGQYLGGFAR